MREGSGAPFALVVEDHPLVAESLVACIRSCDSALDVVTADSLRAALGILAMRPAPLLILTDLLLVDTQGMESVRHLRAVAPRCPLLVVTALDEPALRSEANALGASGYLVKNSSIQSLRQQIRDAIGERPGNSLVAPERAGVLRQMLTAKQLIVLGELAAGRSNKEIATRMNISDETVSSHMKEILARLGVKNRTEAVVRYLQLSKALH